MVVLEVAVVLALVVVPVLVVAPDVVVLEVVVLEEVVAPEVELEPWEDVVDPAGGDLDVFVACAREIADLLHELIPRL